MREFLAELWQSLRPRYTKALEAENSRLRAELEKWQNALLADKGLPPISAPAAKPLPLGKARLLPSQWKQRMESATRKKVEEDVTHVKQ